MRRLLLAIALAAMASLFGPGGSATASALQVTDLAVDGGEDNWHPNRMFALNWNNPSGVAAVHYRLLGPSGGVLIADTRLPWAASAIEHLSVPPTPGAYTAEVWLEDGAGAQGPAAGAKLRFDDARPGAAEAAPAMGWLGRSAFPYAVRLSHPRDPLPIRHPRLRRLN